LTFLYTIDTQQIGSDGSRKSRPVNCIYSDGLPQENAEEVVASRLFVGTGYQSDSELQRRSNPDILVYQILENQETPSYHLLYDPLHGHKGAIYSVCFDEGRVYSGGADQAIRIWELECFYPLDQFQKKCMTIDKQFKLSAYE
jgi:hypothetical protein